MKKTINYSKEGKSNFLLSTEKKLQRILSDIFVKSSFSFQGKQVFVNVLFVDLSADLKNAKIMIDTFGLNEKEEKKELLKQLNKDLVKQIRKMIAGKIKIKYIPEIRFYIDESTERAERINEMIDNEIKKMGLEELD